MENQPSERRYVVSRQIECLLHNPSQPNSQRNGTRSISYNPSREQIGHS